MARTLEFSFDHDRVDDCNRSEMGGSATACRIRTLRTVLRRRPKQRWRMALKGDLQ